MSETKENARLIFAASENCADLRYESGFYAPDPFLWFEVSGQRTVVVSALEFSRAQKECRAGTEVNCTEDLKARFELRDAPAYSASEHIYAISRSLGVRHWQVPENFPLGLAQKLTKRRIRLSTLSPFSPQRAIKTEAETAAIQEGVQLAETGLQRAESILRQSRIGKENLYSGRMKSSHPKSCAAKSMRKSPAPAESPKEPSALRGSKAPTRTRPAPGQFTPMNRLCWTFFHAASAVDTMGT